MKSKQKSHWGNNVPGQEGVLGLTPTPGTPNPGLGSVPPDGGPAVEPPHQLPESLLTSRLHHWGTALQPHRVLWFMMPPFPRPVVHAGPELHVPAAALLLCVGSTFRASSHSRQDQRDCALSSEVTVGSELRPKTFSWWLSETPQATRWGGGQ